MIASHRRAHLRIQLVLWPLAFALLVVAMAGRRPLPLVGAWPDFLANPSSPPSEILWSREDLFGAWPVRLTAHSDGSIEVKPLLPLDRPDLLLYWAGGTFEGSVLPEDARLLGRIAGTTVQRFALPDQPVGSLVVYSLGHQEIVATASFPAPNPESLR